MVKALFKFMRSRYVDDFVGAGKILFRNLTYFRQCEDDGRGDLYEGRHVDRPGGGVKITNTSTGQTLTGDYAFVNSANTESIYVFCASTRFDPYLYDVFDADACVEICSPRQFVSDCRAAKERTWFLEHGLVEYYDEKEPASRDIKDPKHLPFFKPQSFESQSEYRIVLASPKGLSLNQRIVVGSALQETERPEGEQAKSYVLQLRGKKASRQYMRVHYRLQHSGAAPNTALQPDRATRGH